MSDLETPTVVTGGPERSQSGLRAKLLQNKPALIGAGVFLLLIVAVVVYGVTRTPEAPTPAKQTPAQGTDPLKASTVTYGQLGDQDLLNQVNYLMGTKQYAEAEKLISMQSDLATNKTKLSLLITVQTAAGKQDAATQTAEKLAALGGLSVGDNLAIAQQFESAGNKDKAIEYYQKAIDGYKQQKQGSWKSNVARLETKIQELK
jgi:hypothetical protein